MRALNLSLLAVLLLAGSSLAAVADWQAFRLQSKGDLNHDGCIDAGDAVIMEELLNGAPKPGDLSLYALDVNDDYKIDRRDMMELLRTITRDPGCAPPPAPLKRQRRGPQRRFDAPRPADFRQMCTSPRPCTDLTEARRHCHLPAAPFHRTRD